MINWNFRHIKIKIVVLLLAIFIWFFVETENNYKYAFNIPIRITNLTTGKIIINDTPKSAKITFWGRGRELLALILNQKLHYNIDLLNYNKSSLFILDKQNVRLPRITNIKVLNILEPDSIYIEIAELEDKFVPVRSNIEVYPLAGYTMVGDIEFVPDSILAIGPKSVLDDLNVLQTEKLSFHKVKYDINKKVKLIDPGIKYIQIIQNEVELQVDIQKLMEKRIVEVPIRVQNEPRGYELIVIPSSLSLTLIGGVDLLLPLTNKDINAYIDYNKSHSSKRKEHLAYIEKIEGVKFKDIKPRYFAIKKKKRR